MIEFTFDDKLQTIVNTEEDNVKRVKQINRDLLQVCIKSWRNTLKQIQNMTKIPKFNNIFNEQEILKKLVESYKDIYNFVSSDSFAFIK